MDSLNAVILGIIEGLTEFLPVSSTGHLILASQLLKFNADLGKLFDVVIQLGAILAIVVLYWKKFVQVLVSLPWDAQAQHFTRNVLLAFLPCVFIGVMVHDYIKEVLFNPTVVAIALVTGGITILVIERVKPAPAVFSTEQMSWRTALAIGFFQCLAMIPGVSRSGASIMGALMLKVERKAAAEFSFFLAVPTMFAATLYDLYKGRHELSMDGAQLIAIGFVVSFIVALVVVRWMIGFISRHGFTPFAWYRILAGGALLVSLFA